MQLRELVYAVLGLAAVPTNLATGENIAAGQRSAEAVVTAWLDSPEHCENAMGPRFSEMGVAFGLAPSQSPEIYWTQVFGTQL